MLSWFNLIDPVSYFQKLLFNKMSTSKCMVMQLCWKKNLKKIINRVFCILNSAILFRMVDLVVKINFWLVKFVQFYLVTALCNF